jgi:hypothetical protein
MGKEKKKRGTREERGRTSPIIGISDSAPEFLKERLGLSGDLKRHLREALRIADEIFPDGAEALLQGAVRNVAATRPKDAREAAPNWIGRVTQCPRCQGPIAWSEDEGCIPGECVHNR